MRDATNASSGRADYAPDPRARRRSPPAAGDLGTESHLRQTLERVTLALTLSSERLAHGEALQERAESAVATSRRAVAESQQALQATLRASVTAYVLQLRGEHVPPERMLVLVKAAVRDGMPPAARTGERRELMDSVVRWSIDAYYAA